VCCFFITSKRKRRHRDFFQTVNLTTILVEITALQFLENIAVDDARARFVKDKLLASHGARGAFSVFFAGMIPLEV
jgi:hypothetical protein